MKSSTNPTAEVTSTITLLAPAVSGHLPRSSDKEAHKSSEDLQNRVARFLQGSQIPALRDVQVGVDGDTVVLSGRVQTFYERQLAVKFASRVAGVIRLDDRLEVRGYVPRRESQRETARGRDARSRIQST